MIASVFKIALLAALYFAAAKLGLMMDAVSGFATLVWPPTGIALAALLIFGYSVWPGVFIGAILVNIATGAPLPVACGIATGNTLEAVLGTYLLCRSGDFHRSLNRIKDVVSFIIFAVILSPMISATIGVGSLWAGGVKSLEGIGITWRAWWAGDALGCLIVAPLILIWAVKPKIKFEFWRTMEGVLLAFSINLLGLVIFGGLSKNMGIPDATLPYLLFPSVVWAALRFSQPGNVTAVSAISVIAVFGTSIGYGPFTHGLLRDNLFLLHGFMSIIATTGMILAASITERLQAVKARDEFISIASHELRTPLTSLSLQIQMAKRNNPKDPEKTAAIFDLTDRQVKRLTHLVDDLLEVSRIQSGKLHFNFERTNISDLAKEMAHRFSSELVKAGCSLESDIQDNIIGQFDHSRMEQVFDNLVSNAIKYAPGKTIKISLSQNAKKVCLAVEDEGPGIPLDKQSKIFERYERVSSSSHVTGLGLGLFIVKEIAKAHGGTVYLDSQVNKGAKFTVELPI